MKYLILILCSMLIFALSFCLEDEISEQENQEKNNFSLTSIDNSKYTFMNSSISTDYEATNIDKNLVGRWVRHFLVSVSTYKDIYTFNKNGTYDLKSCMDIDCNELRYFQAANGKFDNDEKYYMKLNYENDDGDEFKKKIITYFIHENKLYTEDIYIKTETYKDKSICGKYENKKYYLFTDKKGNKLDEYYHFKTVEIKPNNTIKKIDYVKQDCKQNCMSYENRETTTIVFDDYEYEILGDKILIKDPRKKYYSEKHKGPYALHIYLNYQYFGDTIRLGYINLNSFTWNASVSNADGFYNKEKDVLEVERISLEHYEKLE